MASMKSAPVFTTITGPAGTPRTWSRSRVAHSCRNSEWTSVAEHRIGGITMHPLRKLRESGKPTPAQVSELLAENIVFNSPILIRPIEGRDVCAAIFAQSGTTRGSGTYTAEFKLDERTTFLRWLGTMEGHKFE